MAGPSHLKQGEKGSILAKVSTTGIKGYVIETVEVWSNDPVRSRITLTVKAYVIDTEMPFLSSSPMDTQGIKAGSDPLSARGHFLNRKGIRAPQDTNRTVLRTARNALARRTLSDSRNWTNYALRRDDMICTTITMEMPTNIAATTAYAAAAHPPIFGPSAVRLTPAAALATMQKRTATTVMKLGSFVDFTFLPPAGEC
jgi:hypothetical protein